MDRGPAAPGGGDTQPGSGSAAACHAGGRAATPVRAVMTPPAIAQVESVSPCPATALHSPPARSSGCVAAHHRANGTVSGADTP